MTKDFRGSKSP
jgi:rRNA 2'-O-methyltransferase fibrillarin